MIKVNEYFNGKVKSLAWQSNEGAATIGVIAPGEYEFGTSTKETMTLVSGSLAVLLPDTSTWADYAQGMTFKIEAHKKFKVKALTDVAYICYYK